MPWLALPIAVLGTLHVIKIGEGGHMPCATAVYGTGKESRARSVDGWFFHAVSPTFKMCAA